MKNLRSDQSGMTLIEVLVSISLFAIVTVGFYQVLFSGARGTDTAQKISQVSEEARLGFNRMIRDTREAAIVEDPTPTSYGVKIDFNGDGTFENPDPDDPTDLPDFEVLEFTYVDALDEIQLNGETLIAGAQPIGARPVFDYASNFLEYDWDGNGVTSWQEIDQAAAVGGVTGVGNNNGVLDGDEADFISSVIFSFRVVVDDRESDFFSEAQIRNRR